MDIIIIFILGSSFDKVGVLTVDKTCGVPILIISFEMERRYMCVAVLFVFTYEKWASSELTDVF